MNRNSILAIAIFLTSVMILGAGLSTDPAANMTSVNHSEIVRNEYALSGVSIWTDKPDYLPYETVTIYGEGFNADSIIFMDVFRPDGVVDNGIATSDSTGSFVYYYVLDGIEGTYDVLATDGDGLAHTSFTDCCGMITGYTFHDINGDSIWDLEPPIPGQTINLHRYVSGDWVYEESTTTDAEGRYRFICMRLGDYMVTEELDPEWTATCVPSYPISITSSNYFSYGNNFGNFQWMTVSGYKWLDVDEDEIWDTEEDGYNGWTIYLYDGEDEVASTTTTDDLSSNPGYYEFTITTGGDYSIREHVPAGWTMTHPSRHVGPETGYDVVSGYSVPVQSGSNVDNLNFGNCEWGPPVIVAVTQDPVEPNQYEDVLVTAEVTDNAGLARVTLTYGDTTVDMVYDSADGLWKATIPGQPACTTLIVYVTAYDATGNYAESEHHEKHWADIEEPVIVAIIQDPAEPNQDEDVLVTAEVTDNVAVARVTLTYGDTTDEMAYDDTDGLWKGTIPGQPACTTLVVYVTAYDDAGNYIESERHEKHWADITPPASILVIQDPAEPNQGEDVLVTAQVTDNVGVVRVTLTYGSTTDEMEYDDTDGLWKGTIPGQPACTTLVVYVTAYDAAGNYIESERHEKHWADIENPVIVEVIQTPPEPMQYEDVLVAAEVTDNVAVVRVTLTYGDITNEMAYDDTDGLWKGTIPGQPACTTLEVYVTAYDEAGNSVESERHEKHWMDIEAPVIVAVTQDPAEPNQDEDVLVTAQVTDNVGVVRVTLNYGDTTDELEYDDIDGLWKGTIPGQPACTTLEVYVTAYDAAGNSVESERHEKHWMDIEAPVIVEVLQSPPEPDQGEDVLVTAEVTDNVGVVRVTLTYGDTTDEMAYDDIDGLWKGTIPGQPACTTLEVYITAYDEAGNSIESERHEKHWADIEEPVIVEVIQDPAEPNQDEDVLVTVQVTDNVGVVRVTLTYGSNTDEMAYDDTDGLWKGTIPGQPACTTLEVYVTAYDAAGNSVES
ncbi:MAG: SdrD B-like domain-containing protein, partial [Promethearchaeota archaeon]